MSGLSSENLSSFLSPLFKFFREVGVFAEEFKGQKFSLDLVGGAVRDHVINTNKRVQQSLTHRGKEHLVGRKIKDLDLTTNANKEQLSKLVYSIASSDEMSKKAKTELESKWWKQWSKYKIKHIDGLGEQHGTFSLLFDGGDLGVQQVEITTRSVDLKEDSLRRDLSINAMYMGEDGKIVDHHGGVRDLVIGNLSIPRRDGESSLEASRRILKDDPLRFLRWVRFSGAYGAKTSDEMLAAIKQVRGDAVLSAPDGKIVHLKDLDFSGLMENQVSGNRKKSELIQIVSHVGYAEAFKNLSDAGILNQLFPNSIPFMDIFNALKRLQHANVLGNSVFSVFFYRQPEAAYADLGVRKGSESRKSLNFSTQSINEIISIAEAIKKYPEMQGLSDQAFLKHVVSMVGKNYKNALNAIGAVYPKAMKRMNQIIDSSGSSLHHFKEDLSDLHYFDLSGKDIIEATGIKGPAVGFIHDLIKEGIRHHDIHDIDQAKAFAKHVGNKIATGAIVTDFKKTSKQLISANYSILIKDFRYTKLASNVIGTYLRSLLYNPKT